MITIILAIFAGIWFISEWVGRGSEFNEKVRQSRMDQCLIELSYKECYLMTYRYVNVEELKELKEAI